jgi:2-methylisocitrate lyase-like PEP mutase family enzyme
MTPTTQEKRAQFREMHTDGCFILPNPWDIGSARMLQNLGFEALATTSAGFGWTSGRPDYALSRDEVLGHLTTLSAAVDVPVNADFVSGFAAEPEALAANVRLALGTGIAGLSIKDCVLAGSALFDKARAVERVRAARRAVDRSGEDVLLVARTEILLFEPSALDQARERLSAFADAGADCLYAPGLFGRDAISATVRALAPKPLNVLVAGPGLSFAELAQIGVRRVSVGGTLALLGWATTMAATEGIKRGSFDSLADGMPGAELNEIFGKSS